MYNIKPTLRAMSAPWRQGIAFLLQGDQAQHTAQIVWDDNDTPVPGREIEPSFHLSEQAAQILMDDLWQAGLRPTEGSGSAGSLAATERHLADMRKLVFEEMFPRKLSMP